MAAGVAIDVQNLAVDRGEVRVLDGYSFTVAARDTLAILGANGVGKTTLLLALLGLLQPTAGRVRAAGRIGFVPQLFDVAFDYTAMDVVLMGRSRQIGLFGSPRARDYDVARKYLRRLGIAALEERAFNELSGGQRQLVMIAQALSSECEILVLDEPCAALDYRNQNIVLDVIRALGADFGMTTIFTTHAPQHALAVASHVLLMRDRTTYWHGRVADELTPEHLTALYGVPIAKAHFADGSDFTFSPRFTPAAQEPPHLA